MYFVMPNLIRHPVISDEWNEQEFSTPLAIRLVAASYIWKSSVDTLSGGLKN